jgi:hypothetical protein
LPRNTIKLQVNFEDLPESTPSASPKIISDAPFEFQRQNVTEIDVEQTRGIHGNISATISLVGVKLGLTHSKTKKYKDVYFGKAEAATVANNEGIHSGVWWSVASNKVQIRMQKMMQVSN